MLPIHTPVSDDLKSKLVEAQTEVYNLCARLRLGPEFNLSASSKWSPTLHKGLKAVRFDISVPELELSVCNVSEDAASAGVAACLAFKAEFAQMVQSGSVPVRYQGRETGLTVEMASDFINFYCQNVRDKINPGIKYLSDDHGFVHATAHAGGGAGSVVAVAMSSEEASRFAMMATAIRLARKKPDMVIKFHQHRKRRARMSPIPLHLPSGVLEIMESVTQAALEQESTLDGSVADPNPTAIDGRPFSRYPWPSGPSRDSFQQSLQRRLWTFETAPEFKKMRTHLTSLPMSHHREQVLSLIRDAQNPFSIVVGATGSGKTTQVPQILLDDAIKHSEGADCNIICTQPRRIAATSVATRVAAERGERISDSVGYHVRFDAKLPRPHGSITFCTTGILLAQLKADADGVLNYASHIVIDEVHERDLPTDFLIALLKKAIKKRQKSHLPVPKVVLMSATLDTELFANYLGTPEKRDRKAAPAPSIFVPGRTFPIQDRFLDEIMPDLYESHHSAMESLLQQRTKVKRYLDQELGAETDVADSIEASLPKGESSTDQTNNTGDTNGSGADISTEERDEEFVPVELVAAVVARVAETTEAGAILVFLPGLKEILETERALGHDIFNVGFRKMSNYRIYRLHSSVPREDQNAVFENLPPGCRKIILSTNIAETSVTVPDVQHVVDAGKLREKRYDQLTGVGGLRCVWESKSNSRQRAGRAGRVRNGFYYALFSRERYARMASTGLPELLRSDLQGACLAVKKHSPQSINDFMSKCIQPPPPAAVTAAVQHLKRIKALTRDGELTPLGRLLASLPVHPTLAKMIVMGVIFRCLDPMIILGAASGETRLFVVPLPGQREDAKASHREFGGHESDHISMLQAYNELRTCRVEYGEELARDRALTSYLHWNGFNSIRRSAQSILDVLIRCGLAPASDHDFSSELQYGPPSLNTNSKNHELIRGLLAAGLNPNLAAQSSKRRQFTSKDGSAIVIRHSSQNAASFTKKNLVDRSLQGTLIAFSQLERMDGGGDVLFARDTTIVPPLTALLLADDEVRADGRNLVTLGGWLEFLVKTTVATDGGETGSGDGSPDSSYHSLDVLLRFKSFLNAMLNRAYSDLSKLQRLHHVDECEEAEDEEAEEEEEDGPFLPQQSAPLTEPSISLPDFVEDSLRTIATNAVVVVLDEMKKQPVPKEDIAISAAPATPVIVTNRREPRSGARRIDLEPRRDSSPDMQAEET
ncbi:P-loop containing nucleoside triphosphate hydrolase protein [Apiospora marii]|uniref:P-loop containing nucleoside triphosphate hydrolase protein n=1 Tax=Apiospora marii TaxID=335849 RepID=UPI00312F79E5